MLNIKSVVELFLELPTALFEAGTWVLGSKSLYSSKRDDGEIKFFAAKAFLKILNNDQILLSYLVRKSAKVAVTADIIVEEIDCSKVGSILCNSLDMCAVIFSKWATTCIKVLGSVSQKLL